MTEIRFDASVDCGEAVAEPADAFVPLVRFCCVGAVAIPPVFYCVEDCHRL
jgi:hypothetical protein